MARHQNSPLGYDELAIGDEWESPGRTVTEADVVAFAGLSGDFNPLHVDHAWAARGPFGRPVAHGLLGLALVSGLASHSPRVDTQAFLAILEWNFLLPIAFGDTVRVVSRVESIEPQARGRRPSWSGVGACSTRRTRWSRRGSPGPSSGAAPPAPAGPKPRRRRADRPALRLRPPSGPSFVEPLRWRPERQIPGRSGDVTAAHSHSMVPGGLLVTS